MVACDRTDLRFNPGHPACPPKLTGWPLILLGSYRDLPRLIIHLPRQQVKAYLPKFRTPA